MATYLPHPPTRTEKYAYFFARRRWVFAWLLLAALGVLYGYERVAAKSWLTAPALILIAVMVPPVAVNFWLRFHKPRLGLPEHRSNVSAYAPMIHPGVDVYLPSCGETMDVLNNTFHYVQRLRWRGPINVYVLDDSARPEVRRLAENYGFRYRVRPNRGELKKAGNLINAFDNAAREAGQAPGMFIAVFDADFVPREDFLIETIPYMDDPKIGVVQTAQFFDIDRDMNFIQRYAGSLQEVFFRCIQPARDVHKAAIVAGTNLIYRRMAVEAAGGFARVPIGEDVHSGVKLWWAGYETRYLPLCLAKGIAPDTFEALANQQTRWCRSSMLLMVEKHFREAPFTWQQRLAFWAAFLYYMASAALLITGPFPTLVMLGFFPQHVHSINYLPMLPAVAATLFVFPLMARGWRPTIYRVCMINSACHVYAIYHALKGLVAEWVPTGAATKKDAVPVAVNRILRTWIITVQGLLWPLIAWRVAEQGWRPYWATIALGLVQLYMLAPLLLPSHGLRSTIPDLDAELLAITNAGTARTTA